MKRSDLKELIKNSMLEVAPKKDSGVMTPEEEENAAAALATINRYEKEKKEMDVTSGPSVVPGAAPMKEALNKDIKAFGQDLDKAFKAAGFDTLVLMRGPSAEQMNIVKINPKAVLFLVTETRGTQTLVVYVNPKQIQKAESIINKFQLSNFDGPVLTRGWTAKQVQGAINPGDIVKQDNEKDKGTWYFYRLAQVDTKVKSMEEGSVTLNRDEVYAKYAPLVKQYMESGLDKHAAILKAQDVLAKEYGATPSNIQSTISDYFDDQDRNATYPNENIIREADEIVAAWAEKQTLNEEMYGGYLELFEMNPNFEEGVSLIEKGVKEGASLILAAWKEWKEGPETEPKMVEEAKQDVLAYLSSIIGKHLSEKMN